MRGLNRVFEVGIAFGEVAELATGTGDPGFDGGLGKSENTADLAVAHAVDGFHQERFAIPIIELSGELQEALTFGAERVVEIRTTRGGIRCAIFGWLGCEVQRGVAGVAFAFAGGDEGYVDRDRFQPGLEGVGIANFAGLSDEGNGDFLQEIVEIGPPGLVGQQDRRYPASVVLPKLGEGRAVASDGGECNGIVFILGGLRAQRQRWRGRGLRSGRHAGRPALEGRSGSWFGRCLHDHALGQMDARGGEIRRWVSLMGVCVGDTSGTGFSKHCPNDGTPMGWAGLPSVDVE